MQEEFLEHVPHGCVQYGITGFTGRLSQGGESSEEPKLASCPQQKLPRAGSDLMDVGREVTGSVTVIPEPGT